MDVDVFITNYFYVDPEIFQCWLEGLTRWIYLILWVFHKFVLLFSLKFHFSSEAVIRQRKKISSNIPIELIASDVLDHYRSYSHLEKYLLDSPQKLDSNLIFQLEKESKLYIIDQYYSLDDKICRELLGKKLSSKRKDLDEISDKTGIKLKGCRRQFDNIKRVQKSIDETQQTGSILKTIQREFLLSEDLARKYCAIVFVASQRFELSKKKLAHLSFQSLYECANTIIKFWTYSYQHSGDLEEEFDREFLLDLRELRLFIDIEREVKQWVQISAYFYKVNVINFLTSLAWLSNVWKTICWKNHSSISIIHLKTIGVQSSPSPLPYIVHESCEACSLTSSRRWLNLGRLQIGLKAKSAILWRQSPNASWMLNHMASSDLPLDTNALIYDVCGNVTWMSWMFVS